MFAAGGSRSRRPSIAIDAGTDRLTELSTDLKVIECTPFAVETQTDKITLIGYETTVSILSFR